MSASNFNKKIKYWDKTRDLYTSWTANSELRKYFANNLTYEGFSLWWITKLCNKDNTAFNKWYYRLKSYLFENKYVKYNASLSILIIFLKLFKNFSRDIIFTIIIKIFSFTRFKKINRTNCFYSIENDLTKPNNICYDRIYSTAPLKHKKNKNFHLVNIDNGKEFFINFFSYQRKFKSMGIPHFVANEFINLPEIINIHIKTLKCFFKLFFYLRSKKNIFKIKNKDCKNILEPLLLSSFSGDIQTSLINALSIKNFLTKQKVRLFISYIEFNPKSRSVYYFVRKANKFIKIISYQHSYCNKNVLPYYHRANEFTSNSALEGKYYSPSPDHYMVQGRQFKNLLSQYFKKKIKIVGALRYDLTVFKSLKSNKKNTRKILVCTSIGDEEMLLNYINNLKDKNYHFILCPHPYVKTATEKLFKKNLNEKVNLYTSNKRAFDLLNEVDFVLCGLSSLAFEAMLCNKQSGRVMDPNYQYIYDLNDGTKVLKNYQEIPKLKIKNIKKKYISKSKYLFFKLDNKTYKRFWKYLNSIK